MDSMNDALIALVKALGGSKVVGPMLWPEKMADAAQRVLNFLFSTDCEKMFGYSLTGADSLYRVMG